MSFDKPEDLNKHLEDKSFIQGFTVSSADATVFVKYKKSPDAEKFMHAARWYSHIASLGDDLPAPIKAADPVPAEKSDEPLSKKAQKKLEQKLAKEKQKAETAAKLEAEKAAREANDISKGLYGNMPVIVSAEKTDRKWTAVKDLNLENSTVLVRGRLHNSRGAGNLWFGTIRENGHTVQVVLTAGETVSKLMLKWATGLSSESILDVYGELKKPEVAIASCSQSEIEIHVTKIFVVSAAEPRLPMELADASRPDGEEGGVSQDVRLDNRVIDLRTPANQAIFRVGAAICHIFRDTLFKKGFTEIHSPKLIGTASEGGADVFEVKYFKTKAYLAQSPQLYKQMAICGDFDKVFEVGSVFRAENSQGHRHLTEFKGLDMEMAFKEHYHEVLDVLDDLFISIFRRLETEFKHLVDAVHVQYPVPEFKYVVPSLRLEFKDAIKMLRDDGLEIDDLEDLNTAAEQRLGRLVREKYNTDFFMLDKFPLQVRAFYSMPDPKNPDYANAYDFFVRGEEILSGAQRCHDPDILLEGCKRKGVDPESVKDYIDAMRFGAPPHAGGGIGMERIIMLYLGLKNIRKTSMFPRDPKRLSP